MMEIFDNETLKAAILVGIGLVICFAGKRLFPLFVAVLGFVFGYQIGSELAPADIQYAPLLIGVLLGLIAALLAWVFHRVGIAVAGFFAGYSLVWQVVMSEGWADGPLAYALAVVGGVAGMLLLLWYHFWVVSIASAIFGAALVLHSFDLSNGLYLLLFLLLAVFGFLTQAGYLSAKGFRAGRRK